MWFDPFAGWGERRAAITGVGKEYIGYDTSPEALGATKIADSRYEPMPEFDGLLTCPPYWNLETYAGEGLDRLQTWGQYLADYALVLHRCAESAKPGATFCIMVGNWRKDHTYYDLSFETERILREAGLEPRDKVVVSRKKHSKIKVMLPQAKEHGYSVNVHEHLLVYTVPR